MKRGEVKLYRFVFIFLILTSVVLASPLEEYNENNQKNDKLVSFKSLNSNENTFLVIHVNIQNEPETEDYEDNLIFKGLKSGINSYIDILEDILPNRNNRRD